MSDLVVSNIICFQTQKQLATLNKIQVLLKSVLIDLCACNFVHAKTSLYARCVHTCHRAQNLSSPASVNSLCETEIFNYLWLNFFCWCQPINYQLNFRKIVGIHWKLKFVLNLLSLVAAFSLFFPVKSTVFGKQEL